MKHLIVAAVLVSVLWIEPSFAGSASAPIMDPDVVAGAAVDDSTAKVDSLMLAIFYILFLAAAGGAF